MVSSYVKIPNFRGYWSSDGDTRSNLISVAISRARFGQIMQSLHFTSEIIKGDKYWKVRPLSNHLLEMVVKYFEPEQQLALGEIMVKYMEKNFVKQATRNKPIRFGYKIRCVNTTNGHLVAFYFKQTKSVVPSSDRHEKLIGKSGSILLNLIDNFPVVPLLFFMMFFLQVNHQF